MKLLLFSISLVYSNKEKHLYLYCICAPTVIFVNWNSWIWKRWCCFMF